MARKIKYIFVSITTIKTQIGACEFTTIMQ